MLPVSLDRDHLYIVNWSVEGLDEGNRCVWMQRPYAAGYWTWKCVIITATSPDSHLHLHYSYVDDFVEAALSSKSLKYTVQYIITQCECGRTDWKWTKRNAACTLSRAILLCASLCEPPQSLDYCILCAHLSVLDVGAATWRSHLRYAHIWIYLYLSVPLFDQIWRFIHSWAFALLCAKQYTMIWY